MSNTLENLSRSAVRVGRSIHGLGVFAVKPLGAKQWLGPIEGEIIDDPEYESDYCMELGADLALEPASPFRYVNHSCHPNCSLIEIETEYDHGRLVPELWLQVDAEIAAGQQITIDYGWPARAAVPCECGSADCRHWIVAANELDRVLAARKS